MWTNMSEMLIKVHKSVQEFSALLFINILAFAYDGNLIMLAMGINALVLGIGINDFKAFTKNRNTIEKE